MVDSVVIFPYAIWVTNSEESTMAANPQPTNGRITDFSEWQEKTIRCVISNPSGPRGYSVSAVVVFEDDTWSTLIAQGAGACEDEAHITLGSDSLNPARITDYLSAQDLLQAGMVNQAQFEHLRAIEDAKRKEHLLRQAERLRAQAEKALADAQGIERSAQQPQL
jgi:hypothetical protein